jgi:hypothetical protein
MQLHPRLDKPGIRKAAKPAAQALTALVALLIADPAQAQTVLPPDAKPTCIVAADEFKSWFAGGLVAKDGIVLPANSLAFSAPATELCPFFKWSTQMFLWLTSPVGTGHVFSTRQFYEVLPVQNGTRTLRLPETPGQLAGLAPTITQRGPKGQEVVFDSAGKIHDVVRPEGGRLVLFDAANQLAEVGEVRAESDGKPQLLDKSGKSIQFKPAQNGAPLLLDAAGPLRDRSGKPIDLAPRTVTVNGKPALLTTSGAVLPTEQGQADDTVLMSQNQSIVYYLIQVNDVLAYFRTGAKDGKITPAPTSFPTTQDLLDKITAVAQQAPPPHTRPQFQDAVALTMEIKSSWVETKNLANPGDYITINTFIPDFTLSADKKTLTPESLKLHNSPWSACM